MMIEHRLPLRLYGYEYEYDAEHKFDSKMRQRENDTKSESGKYLCVVVGMEHAVQGIH